MLTPIIEIPKLYEQEHNPNPIVYAKYYLEETDWTWYVMEYSPMQKLCFGYVIGDEAELGYFSLDELESIEYKFGLSVELDTDFEPTPLKEIQDERN